MAKSKNKSKQIWRDRATMLAPYFGLVLSEEDFQYEMDVAKIPMHHRGRWVREGSSATCHTYANEDGKMVCLVAMEGWEKATAIQIVGLLIHEAVHIWQSMCENIGENEPSREFEAYSIQWISQELMESFSEQTNYGQLTPER